ncbi:MAG: 16S rRNA (uracil(1498)-N(3))-methyltransferase [Flavobacteriales bacterium]|nr:16S rRNA (uracil(1498)-N(3))-methyltransferase [Flavobacteriales bacterium]
MQLFYTPDINLTASTFILDEAESKHAVKVLRLATGDKINLVDGKGTFFEAEITQAHAKKCELCILSSTKEANSKSTIHIAIAPTKNNDRLEWFVEKATEIGIAEITPLICQRSERKILKTDRLEKTAVAAMKQSIKANLPKINEPITFKDFIKTTPKQPNLFIAHCLDNQEKHLSQICAKNEPSIVLIGPEGDFTKEEIDLAIKNQFKPISLGKSRLRTETAGIVACHTINLLNE